ncbi:hypothetical protein JKG68_10580 [Microvirga aerilata]|uniref:Uncharacterized protein n=1 Tax=Microvirga aerilata TaxID=670292 RepID=A0A937CXN8_9HYPH|nr:hypothetical protein [Microvirga aerilata]MBL0404414.1 hypothetical protein [Microvirga aerilata]
MLFNRRYTYDPTQASPLICEMIASGRYEGNGPPHWKVGRFQKSCQTAEDAEQQRYELIDQLRRASKHNPAALVLANRLEICHRLSRCMSGACPECLRILQRWFVASSFSFLKELGQDVSILSLVPPDQGMPIGQFGPEVLPAMANRVRKAMEKAGITIAVGGLDFSANEHEADEFTPYYQPQLWVLIPRHEARKSKANLLAVFPPTHTTRRPVKILKWNGNRAALAYAIKSKFNRRMTYDREASDNGSQHACQNTRHRPLRVEQQIELMIALDQAGLNARLFMRGARIVRTNHGPMIRPITKLNP